MSYHDSSSFVSFCSLINEQLGLSPIDSKALLEKSEAFFNKIEASPSGLKYTENLLSSLFKNGIISYTQIEHVLTFLQLILTEENTSENNQKAVALIYKILNSESSEKVTDYDLNSLCIKYLLPAIYNLGKHRTVEPLLCFMQPRQGLNQAFRYLYRKLEKGYPWKLKLYELHRETAGLDGYLVNAAWFIRDMSIASAVFVHESNNLMGHLDIRPETPVIQLWHGCGVFKHIGLSTADKDGFKSMERYNEFPEYNKYSLVTIASDELTWVFEEFMGIPKESNIIQPLGVARTDEFYDNGYVDKCYKKLYKAIPEAKNKKVILYAPTYRGVDPNRVSPDALDIPRFAERLGDNYILIMKHHQTVRNVPAIPDSYRDSFAYDMTRGKGMNINELMTVADICITDYSSVAFEFSLFERPLLFFVFDLEDYIDNRGLYYKFDEITPGPLCRTTDEMADYIEQLGEHFDASVISDFRKRFMCGCDGHACERTIRFLIQKTLPVPSDFSSIRYKQRKEHHFAGWNVYQLENSQKLWLCQESKWLTEEEMSASHAKKALLNQRDAIKKYAEEESCSVFYSPVWKADTITRAAKDYIHSLHLRKRLKSLAKPFLSSYI